jgi:prepilin-type N-terminal cleavage/methylation domain-containing protein
MLQPVYLSSRCRTCLSPGSGPRLACDSRRTFRSPERPLVNSGERSMKSCGTPPHSFVEPGPWWAQLVGASRVHPPQHCAHHPLKSGGGLDERTRCGGEELPEAETPGQGHRRKGRVSRPVRAYGSGRGRFPQCPRPPVGRSAGFTLVELLFTVMLLCILAGISVPSVLAAVDRSRGAAAARYLASRMALARARAVGRSTMVALRFEEGPRGTSFSVVADGNGDGVRTRDLDQQIDRVIEAPVLLSDLFPGASIGLAPGTPATDAVALGGTTILSFSPNGTATSGSVYVVSRDRSQWVVRVLGVTARARVLRYERATNGWVSAD